MRKNTTESKLVYLGKWKKKIINALYQAGVLLPENASWERVMNGIIAFRQRKHGDAYIGFSLIDGMKIIADTKNTVHKIKSNSYDPSYKYPINVNLLNDMNIIDVDSPEFDINVAMCLWLFTNTPYMKVMAEKYITTITNFNDRIQEEINKTLKKNLYKHSDTLNDPEYWNNLQNWTKETGHDVPGEPPHTVISYTGSWMDIRLMGDGYELNQIISKDRQKTYTYSVYLKADKDATVSFFPKTTNNSYLTIEPGYQGIKVSNKWERHTVKITVKYITPKNGDSPWDITIPLNPVIQSPENIKLYLALPMLIEGHEEVPYNNGTPTEDPILKNIVTTMFNKNYLNNFFYLFDKVLAYPLEYPGILEDPHFKVLLEKFKSRKSKEIIDWVNGLNESFVRGIQSNVVPIHGSHDKNRPDVYFHRTFNPKSDRYIPNPYMGYVPYCRWGEYGPEITTVYADMRWREVDKVNERYDITEWKKISRIDSPDIADKDILFRLILDEPSDTKHSDLPPALTIEPTYGKYYDNSYGKGFAPNYEAILPEFQILARDVGQQLMRIKNIKIHQLGVLGHWGEWHNNYGEGVAKIGSKYLIHRYIEEYNFGTFSEGHRYATEDYYCYFMMRRPFYLAKDKDMGVFNDMLGDKPSTDEWLDWINNGGPYDQTPTEENLVVAYPEVLRKGINAGELTSGIPMEDLLGKDLETTIETIKNSHVRMIGQKIPDKSVNEESYWKILEHVGYRIHIKDMTIKSYLEYDYKNPTEQKNKYILTLTIENKGNAFFSGLYPNYSGLVPNIVTIDKNFIDLPEGSKYNADIYNYSSVNFGILNLEPGQSIKISTKLNLDDHGRSRESKYLFYIKEKFSGKYITFDNEDFDKFLTVGIQELENE